MTQAKFTQGPVTFTAGEDLVEYRRVKLKAGTAVPASVEYADAGEDFIGITMDNAKDGELITVAPICREGTFLLTAAGTFDALATLYGAADGKVDDVSSGTAFFKALEAATAAGDIVECILHPGVSTTAATVSIADTDNHTSKATVEAALAEIYQHVLTAKGIIDIPLPVIEADGTALAVFGDGDSTTPGFCATAEGMGIRWNNHANPDPVATKILVPPDMNTGADAVLHILAAKTGNAVGDATKFTIQAFNNDVDALYDADADFGGDTDAMTGDAAAKTVQHVTRTLAHANLTAYPAAIELTIQPKDGTLGTDDVIMLKAWVEYQRKILTA
jgi:hypothetical protein